MNGRRWWREAPLVLRRWSPIGRRLTVAEPHREEAEGGRRRGQAGGGGRREPHRRLVACEDARTWRRCEVGLRRQGEDSTLWLPSSFTWEVPGPAATRRDLGAATASGDAGSRRRAGVRESGSTGVQRGKRSVGPGGGGEAPEPGYRRRELVGRIGQRWGVTGRSRRGEWAGRRGLMDRPGFLLFTFSGVREHRDRPI